MQVQKPLLIFDGDCGFCRFYVEYWRQLTGDRVDYAPFQAAAQNFPEIPLDNFKRSVQFIEPPEAVSSAAEAVFRLMALAAGYRRLLWLYKHAPGFAPLSETAYRIVAGHRSFFDKFRRLFWGRALDPPTHFLTRAVFLRLLGVVYLAAFASLWPQIGGLIGAHGILPAQTYLAAIAHTLGPERYHLIPTLAWLSASDGFLKFLAGGGTVLSLLLIFDVAPGPVLLLLWLFYLSLVSVGQDFMSFQWDILLLEAGFLAIFFAPWKQFGIGWMRRDSAKAARPPSKTIVWLLRWLLFRLVFLSGCVKLLSHDPTWRNLTALDYHYETQPLPTPVAWYAFQLPGWFQKASTAGVFFFELAVPFLIFFPRRLRLLGCALLIFFQLLIAITGNYAYFNLLAIALCLLLLDDQFLRRVLPRAITSRVLFPRLLLSTVRVGSSAARKVCLAVLAVVILLGSMALFAATLFGSRSVPRAALSATAEWLEPFHIVNSYGLFAVMTTERTEIIIQGSNDGVHWQDYGFKYKPGPLDQRPGWVAPYQPRLDWQMWFAALSNYRSTPWFVNLMIRLLQGSPQVLGLLGRNPFPGAPPRYVRAVAYDYTFTNFAERRATGDWWQRKEEGLYFPVAGFRSR
ncbi:MAG TPA: lipase maturation factor family protein [Terriglobia bacterium]|nr:lipase maturation factor family protein [Terriglobia bacterium]